MATFADVLPVEQTGSHQYTVNFTDPWCIGTVPNGGYVTSAFMTVARKHMQTTHPKRAQKHVINLHLEFMRRTAIGSATFTVEDVKLGSRISNLHLTLSQEDERTGKVVNEVQGYITMSNIEQEEGLNVDPEHKMLPAPLPVSLEALAQNKDENYRRRSRDPLRDFRKASENMIMHLTRLDKRPSDFPKAMIDQWVFFKPEGREGRHTNDSLGYVVDIFPQILERYHNADIEDAAMTKELTKEEGQTLIKSRKRDAYWYPTLSLNLDVKKALPDEGVKWLFVRVQATKVSNGRFDYVIHVLDEAGDLVALSSHASLAVDNSRNLKRGGQGKQKSKL